ncbi:hypothetical protein P2318_04815 [Myxococcaceae bacterium GXIMD 01537]
MRRLVALALLALAPACNRSQEGSTPPPLEGQLEPVPNPHGDMTRLPDPELQEGRVGRAPRRITVAQLDASIRTAVGREWTDLDDLAPSMGRADYALIVSENTEPNLVFAKFLEDGARKVCLEQATAEVKLADPAARVLSRTLPTGVGAGGSLTALTDAQVRELLVHLSTRFWGAPLGGDELTRWEAFFKKAATRSETLKKREQALAAVCIALLTDSRFFTY